MRPLPTTARIALLAMLLALLSNLALLGFIHLRTRDTALTILRQRVSEESRALGELHAAGGRRALAQAIQQMLTAGDPELVIAVVGQDGRPVAGNLRGMVPATALARTGFQPTSVSTRGKRQPLVAGVVIRSIEPGFWLLSGRSYSDRVNLQLTLERSLLLALVLAIMFGAVCGLITARYVGIRVRSIANAVDKVGEGDLTRRVAVGGSGDAFDVLSSRINLMLNRIGALMGELRLLTDGLAHDLRSPVGRLRARIEQALTVEDEAQRDALLGGVLKEADSLMNMLSTVLEISRTEAMAGRDRFAWLEPGELASELAEMYEPIAEEAGVALSCEKTGVPLPLHGHRQLLAQALSNLLDNALAYGATGGEIILFVEQHEDGLRIGVADRGPGIATGDMNEARRRFGRLDASRSRPGAGLGLALVDSVAHLHDGRLELSDNNPGLRAAIVLPVSAGRPANDARRLA